MVRRQIPGSRFIADKRAGAAVEFAISALALFLFLLSIINVGYLGLDLSALQHGADSAARAASVQTADNIAAGAGCSTASQVTTYFNQAAAPPLPTATGNIDGTPYVVTSWVNNSTSNTVPGTYLTVTASYSWTPVGLPFAVQIPLKISVTRLILGTSGATTTCS